MVMGAKLVELLQCQLMTPTAEFNSAKRMDMAMDMGAKYFISITTATYTHHVVKVSSLIPVRVVP
jgi:hypothetical protein